MAKRRLSTNDPRRTNQPFHIDRLPAEVRDAIEYLYTKEGRTWAQISERSTMKYCAKWRTEGGGFVPWDDLPTSVLELFPDLRLPISNLHRYYKVRIAQAAEASMERAEYARQLAKSFVGANVEGDKDAVLNAARDIFFGILSEDGSLPARAAAGKALLSLAKEQQKARTNDIRERQVAVDEQALQMKLDQIKAKAEALLEAVGKGPAGDAVPMSREELMQQVRGIYGLT